MTTFKLTASGAQMVGHNVGDTITRSDLFDNTNFCDEGELGFTVDAENLPKDQLRAHVFLKPEDYEAGGVALSGTAMLIRQLLKNAADANTELYYNTVDAGSGVMGVDDDGEEYSGEWGAGGHIEHRGSSRWFSVNEAPNTEEIVVSLGNCEGEYWSKKFHGSEVPAAVSYGFSDY